MFDRIDKDNDRMISFVEFLDWVHRFLAVPHYFGVEFWVNEDALQT
jgi:hypothetical protein